VVVTEKAAAVYQRGHWLISNISDVRIMWNITACIMVLFNDTTPKVSVIGDIHLAMEHE
jgi:hypothetical protein